MCCVTTMIFRYLSLHELNPNVSSFQEIVIFWSTYFNDSHGYVFENLHIEPITNHIDIRFIVHKKSFSGSSYLIYQFNLSVDKLVEVLFHRNRIFFYSTDKFMLLIVNTWTVTLLKFCISNILGYRIKRSLSIFEQLGNFLYNSVRFQFFFCRLFLISGAVFPAKINGERKMSMRLQFDLESK